MRHSRSASFPLSLVRSERKKKTHPPHPFPCKLQTISFFPKTNLDTLNSGIFSVQKDALQIIFSFFEARAGLQSDAVLSPQQISGGI